MAELHNHLVLGYDSAAFARIRGYVSTLSKQHMPLLMALASLFRGKPLYPGFA